jgi:hypothetical protein
LEIRDPSLSLGVFKAKLKTFLFTSAYTT